MLDNKDRAEVMKLIAQAKQEIRKEFWDFSNNNYNDKKSMKNESAISFITLAENGQIDDVTITEHSIIFNDWEVGIDYKQNDIRKYADKLYKCLQSHTSQEDWAPDKTPSLWKEIGNPQDEFPQWSQPIGAGDAYMTGDKVTFKNKHYISNIDNNVWAPDVYGWSESN